MQKKKTQPFTTISLQSGCCSFLLDQAEADTTWQRRNTKLHRTGPSSARWSFMFVNFSAGMMLKYIFKKNNILFQKKVSISSSKWFAQYLDKRKKPLSDSEEVTALSTLRVIIPLHCVWWSVSSAWCFLLQFNRLCTIFSGLLGARSASRLTKSLNGDAEERFRWLMCWKTL